ncbi:MAG: outer membrane lipoprotein-sorting protein [Pseudomonadota bacterium]
MATEPAAQPDASPNGLAGRFAELVIRYRWLWLVLSLVFVGLAVVRISAIWPPDPSARIFFAPENPDRQALDRFEATFGKDDNLNIVVVPDSGVVFEPATLAAIGDITEQAWRLPLVRRVTSLTNFQHTFADAEGMVVRDLVPDPANVTPEGAAEAERLALERAEIVGSFLPGREGSSDVTQVQVVFKLPGIEPSREIPEIVRELRLMVADIEEAHPVDIRLTGGVMVNNQFAVSGQQDGATLFGPMFVAILLVVGLALRSVLGAGAVFVVILLSAAAGLGGLGWMGLPLNSVTVLAPLYIMTLAVASAVHILNACRAAMADTGDRKEWVRRALTDHAGAIIIACVTTSIGFFSLNFSISPPFRELGNIVGIGVLAALVLTLFLLPALIILLPIRRQAAPARQDHAMSRIAEFVIAQRRIILPGMLALVVALVAGMSQIRLEDDFLRYFDERYEFRQDTDFTEERLTGVNLLEYALPAGGEQAIYQPAYLAEQDAFVSWLRAQPEVAHVRTLTDTLKRLTMNMNEDDPAFFRLPETEMEASQFLFLYELSLSYGQDLTDQIPVDRSSMRISVSLANVTTTQMRELTAAAGDWLKANAPIIQAAWEAEHPELEIVTPTGIVHVFNVISYRDVRAMLTGTAIALVLISGIIMLALGSVRIGLISLVPNLIPAAMAFGIWGYSVGAVTLAIAVVLAATLGIVVDDTVHFLSKYAAARKRGASPEDSVRYAFGTVGRALLITTIGLVAGFAVLAQSGFAVNGDMAKLTAITITVALLADFLLLPSLLIWLDTRSDAMTAKAPTATTALLLLAAPLLATLAFAPGAARADSPEAKGLAIAEEADRRDLGYGAYRVDGEMVLRDAGGAESRRVFENLVMEREPRNEGDLSVIVFSRPRDIRGTGLLTHANIEPSDDDQWLYLPAIKRVKRISSSNRTGKFVSSEFSYEDLGSQEVDDYTYKWIRDEPCPAEPSLNCHVVESYPKNAKSGYSKRTSWVDDVEFRQWRVEFHNRRGDLEKTLRYEGYNQYKGKFWRADKLLMENLQTGKETDLLFTGYDFSAGLDSGDFDPQRLPRMAR